MQAAVTHRQMDASFSWDDFNWLRKLWPRKLLVEGILRPDDAERCVAAGADGVILSNHGGRQLDAAVSPLDVLAESRARIAAPLLIDSGYRRGTDIVKALALGANAVLLGRATLYGLAAAGKSSVRAFSSCEVAGSMGTRWSAVAAPARTVCAQKFLPAGDLQQADAQLL
jgi:(S)-mandelate dehydrogenase